MSKFPLLPIEERGGGGAPVERKIIFGETGSFIWTK